MTGYDFMGGCVMDYFLAGSSDFVESPLVSWQHHGDNKTSGQGKRSSHLNLGKKENKRIIFNEMLNCFFNPKVLTPKQRFEVSIVQNVSTFETNTSISSS